MQVYSSGTNFKLYNGNMLDVLSEIEPNSVDSIVTDPPHTNLALWGSLGITLVYHFKNLLGKSVILYSNRVDTCLCLVEVELCTESHVLLRTLDLKFVIKCNGYMGVAFLKAWILKRKLSFSPLTTIYPVYPLQV